MSDRTGPPPAFHQLAELAEATVALLELHGVALSQLKGLRKHEYHMLPEQSQKRHDPRTDQSGEVGELLAKREELLAKNAEVLDQLAERFAANVMKLFDEVDVVAKMLSPFRELLTRSAARVSGMADHVRAACAHDEVVSAAMWWENVLYYVRETIPGSGPGGEIVVNATASPNDLRQFYAKARLAAIGTPELGDAVAGLVKRESAVARELAEAGFLPAPWPQPRPDGRPHWDEVTRQLTWRDVSKEFKQRATRVTAVLSAFQKAGWPAGIKNPTPARLTDVIDSLNDSISFLEFRGNGTAEEICWAPAKPSP